MARLKLKISNRVNYQHKQMAAGRWREFDLIEQMANIGSEVGRTISWRQKNNLEYSRKAFERALELLDLTIADPKNKNRLSELCRLRETMVDYFVFDNQYKSSDQLWQNYFYHFNFAARAGR